MGRRRTKQAQISQTKEPSNVFSTDAFSNVLARLGTGTPNMLDATQYPLTRLTQNYQLMNSLYRSHWIIRRIIDVIPEDMLKNGYRISSQTEPIAIDRIEDLIRRAHIKQRLLEALRWSRLYGGSAAVMIIDGQDDLSQPLDIDMVMPGSFKGLIVVDRWAGINPMTELVTDINSSDFGLPAMYQITNNAEHTVTLVHHSRILRFSGRDLPIWESQAEIYWGASEVEHVFDEIKKRDNTSFNIAQLVFLANLRVLKIGDLGQMLSTGNAHTQQQIYQTIQSQNWLMSNMGMYLLDKEDEFDTKQYTFSGLSDVYEGFMMDVAGAAEIPVTRLFGRSPSGLNATGESDLQNYYDMIESNQEAKLRPVLDKLLPVLFVSELGAVPDDLDFKFNPVRRASDTEKSDLGQKRTQAVIDAFNAGLVSQRSALQELRQMEDSTGMWSNISDADIAKADEQVSTPGEDFSLGTGLFGENFNVPSGVADSDWDESEHPRAENGQFGEGGGSGSSEEKSAFNPEEDRKKILNGTYPSLVLKGKQRGHTEGTQEFRQKKEKMNNDPMHPSEPAIVNPDINVQQLVDTYKGTGKIKRVGKAEYPREDILGDKTIGKTWYKGKEKYVDTRAFQIIYSSKGVHVVPLNERRFK